MESPGKELLDMKNWMKDGRVCWGIIWSEPILRKQITDNPQFLTERVSEVVNLRWLSAEEETPSFHSPVFSILEKHFRDGWRVSHLMIYAGDDDVFVSLMEQGLIHPVKDDTGKSLTQVCDLIEVDLPQFAYSFRRRHPRAYLRLKWLEFNEEQKRKLLLLCWEEGRQANHMRGSEAYLLKEIIMLIGMFLFTDQVASKMEENM